ncbi:MAG TPA: 50S ribosomal protein L21 [Candidatus Peribacteraceae bacterium]|nr:50S ribosomal protein L21 [Candidatus Peribacteraceae bacterium]
MFAVVSIGGFQEMVKEGDTLNIPLQDAEENKTITFGDVLMVVKDGGDLMLGAPFVKDASVEVKVLNHGRGDKIRVVKFRHRKRYTRTKGHRQHHTSVQVTKIKI